MTDKYQRVYAQIDLDAIQFNMDNMKANINENTKIMAIIKTDGYGHGSIPIAKVLEKNDYMYGFGVATVEEALILRKSEISMPILILGYTFPYCYGELIKEQICPTVFRMDMAEELSAAALKLGTTVKVHVKVDTGMSRIGVTPDKEGLDFVKKLNDLKGIEIEGIFTHFARADEECKEAAREQLKKFNLFIQDIENQLKIFIPIKHCSNSAGIVEMPEANLDMVRAGITLYGLWPSNQVKKNIVQLKPVLSLYSHIVYLKEMQAGYEISYGGTYTTTKPTKVATIPVGYGDGYPRSLSNKGYVLIRGQKAPILGKICMDQFMVDVSNIQEAREGDLVTLVGKDGDKTITAEEIGELSDRFNYEFVCDLGKRIPRVYIREGKIIGSKDYYNDIEYLQKSWQ